MFKKRQHTYNKFSLGRLLLPNHWDVVACLLCLLLLLALGWVGVGMTGRFDLGQSMPITLAYSHLPYYALRSVVRLFVALLLSLLVTFIFGTWAAKSPWAEKIIVPMIDVLQSVPVLGFLTIFSVFFITLFHGSMMGPESAAIFAIFTAQVWNMILSLYQGIRQVPAHLHEAARMFHLTPWQRFWRIEVPFATPSLLWNTMMSMSGSWVFLMASESFQVLRHNVRLPGVGSYLAVAIVQANFSAMIAVIITMLVVIVLYDQLLFRPLVAWSEKFKDGVLAGESVAESWVLNLLQKSRWLMWLSAKWMRVWRAVINCGAGKQLSLGFRPVPLRSLALFRVVLWLCFYLMLLWIVYAMWSRGAAIVSFVQQVFSWRAVGETAYLGFLTLLRVAVVVVLSSLIWVPVGVYVGLRPKLAEAVQPVIQFLAAFPANLLFPLATILLLRYHLNINVCSTLLMMLGTQWYIFFNVVAGTTLIPKNLQYAVNSLSVPRLMWWRKLILPGIFPYYITGAVTAAGGAWNISIIAEVISWGHHRFVARGLGAYITQAADQDHLPALVLAIVMMSAWVLLINRLLWRPLYRHAQQKFVLA